MSMIRALRLAAEAVLIVAVLAYSGAVTRHFARYADHYPYLSLDDALANVSYSLANEGRYGFMASPVQAYSGAARHHSFFNYGPWYFFFGAGLISIFGYNFVLLRGIHLIGVLAIAATGMWWFGRRKQVVAGAVLAFGVLEAFDVSQWPMVRPDIAVSVFAVLFIVAAGRAIERRSALAWTAACAAAGCAALSHLIAWVLVPCAAAALAISMLSERADPRRRTWMLAAAFGFLAAAVMFYGSFGFRIGDHLALLFGYRQFLSQTPGASAGFSAVLGAYLHLAFDYLTTTQRWLLGASTVLSAILLAVCWRQPVDARRRTLTLLLPPVIVFIAYTLSLGTYTNSHAGYVILVQVGAWWCLASVIAYVVLRLSDRSAALATVARLMVACVMIAVIGVHLSATRSTGDRLERIGEWASIRDYTDRVLQLIPAGATVWGSMFFGIESPERVQLIQLSDGLDIVDLGRQKHSVNSADMAPQFVVWGYSDRRDAVMAELAPKDTRQPSTLFRLGRVLPGVSYRLAEIVVGAPYGVTRVYARAGASESAGMPVVQAYDPAAGVWDARLEESKAIGMTAATPVTFTLGSSALTTSSPADRSVALDVPAGSILFRVHVARSEGASRRMLAVTQTPTFRETYGELGPTVDLASYFSTDTDAYLFHDHSGGPIYISQFDDGAGAAILGVDVFKVAPARQNNQIDHLTFWDLPSLARWVPLASPAAGIHAKMVGDALAIEGNDTRGGYQVQAPPVPVPPGTHVTVRTEYSGQGGVVCVGALNGAGSGWLRRDGHPSRDIRFVADDTAAFRLTFYNCNGSDAGNAASRFSISKAQYAVDDVPAVDRWMSLLDATPIPGAAPPDFRIRAVPPGLALSAGDFLRAPAPIDESDLVFRAPMVSRPGGEWKLTGRAVAGFSYALVLKPKLLMPGRHFFARGRVDAGGVTFGLQAKGDWVGQIDVTTPGEFIVELQAPRLGRYTAVVAHYIADSSLQSDVTISQLGWLDR